MTSLPNHSRLPLSLPRPGLAAHDLAAFWLQAFLYLQIACQLALLSPIGGSLRILLRSMAFGASLALLALVPGRGWAHPARPWALASLVVVGLELCHPDGNTALARLAQAAMYVAILGPLFWAARLHLTVPLLRRILLILWAFHTLSATFGVLQVYYPGSFQPNVSSSLTDRPDYVDSLKITLAGGQRMIRPMGLTDTPGGAATAGLYAALFGLGFFLAGGPLPMRLTALASIGVGLFCIYLSQVRSILVMAGICMIVFAAVLARRGELNRFLAVGLLLPAIVLASFQWAVSIGGATVTDRLGTLIEDRPTTVYYQNRGQFLEHTVYEILPTYPLGAGLGRWGMMNRYFGDNSDPERGSIWVEIQWTAWLLDGGVLLALFYSTAILIACWTAWRISQRAARGTAELWAALILAYNVGSFAVTFNYTYFQSQGGMEFWLLNACLFGAAARIAPRRHHEHSEHQHPG